MKYIDAELLRKEIERRKKAIHATIFNEEYDDLLRFIDSLQQEQPSEDLEEAAKKYGHENVRYWYVEGIGGEVIYDDFVELRDAFIAGAIWEKGQMLKVAVEGVVVELGETYKVLSIALALKEIDEVLQPLGLKDGDKVKIVIVKEGGK